jgi:hypothetical protein
MSRKNIEVVLYSHIKDTVSTAEMVVTEEDISDINRLLGAFDYIKTRSKDWGIEFRREELVIIGVL